MAKFYNHSINYVLIIYILNLAAVSVNLGVYFINRQYDKAKEITKPKDIDEMGTPICNQAIQYEEMNNMSTPDGVVFFGSNTFSQLPVSELAKSYNIQETIYNRSVCDEEISNIIGALDICVLRLSPSKVFINLGDVDIESGDIDINNFIEKYEWILYSIHTKTNADIYVVSLLSNLPVAIDINNKLRALAEETGSHYIDASGIVNSPSPQKHLFELLKLYIRSNPMDFADAMLG